MSAVSRGPEFAVCRYITSLPIPGPAFTTVGRALLLMPERRWPRFAMNLMSAYEPGSPEYKAAAKVYELLRSEVSA